MPRMDRLSSYKTAYTDNEKGGCVIYQKTKIVDWKVCPQNGLLITLNSDGWETSTTKRKMNQASNQFGLGYSVFQKDFNWFVTKPDGQTIPYVDNMEFS